MTTIVKKDNETKVVAPTVKPVENEQLGEVKQVDTPIKSDELINNAEENKEDNNEIDKESQAEKEEEQATGMVVVQYIGNGVYIDDHKDMWANVDKSKNILKSRQYTVDEYELRKDLQFMVKYGEMTAIKVQG